MSENKKNILNKGYQPNKKTGGHQPSTSGPTKPPKKTMPSIKPLKEK
ncbi:hypothetical protein M1Q06_15165 [Planococcus sp. 11815]